MKETWYDRFKKSLTVKCIRNHHYVRVSHLRGFIQAELKSCRKESIEECISLLHKIGRKDIAAIVQKTIK